MSQYRAAFPATLRAVIFDLDGTLLDTADEFVPAVQRLRAEHGLEAMDPARIRVSVSNGARALVSLGLNLHEEAPEFESKRLRLLDLYSEVLGTMASTYPGIDALLASDAPHSRLITLSARAVSSVRCGSVAGSALALARRSRARALATTRRTIFLMSGKWSNSAAVRPGLSTTSHSLATPAT